jgi:hypothetical protein
MRRFTVLLVGLTAVVGCTSGPTAPSTDMREPPSARFDGGFLGGSGNRAGDSNTTTPTGTPPLAGPADSIYSVEGGGFLGGSGN